MLLNKLQWHKIIACVTLLIVTQAIFAKQQPRVGLDFVDHVYTINLPQSVDRKQHIVQEFKRVGIRKYEIFVAIDKDDPEVAAAMRSKFVKKYPPCFRCLKIFCKCENNVLIKHQIGNWYSFIHIFEDIVRKNYEFVLITEDDLKFNANYKTIFNQLINAENFARYGIKRDRPILIRLEARSANKYSDKIKFTKDRVMSNACFIVNKRFAQSFLQHLKIIDRTSDMYIHYQLMDLDPTIQHFTAAPAPTYQLSSGPHASMYSEIHPKGIDAVDKQRAQQHKKRVEYWEYLRALAGI